MNKTKLVKAVDDWDWWYKVGEIYKVRKYDFKATRGATVNSCYCHECVRDRKGKELFDMYVVVEGDHIGSIIPVIACVDV